MIEYSAQCYIVEDVDGFRHERFAFEIPAGHLIEQDVGKFVSFTIGGPRYQITRIARAVGEPWGRRAAVETATGDEFYLPLMRSVWLSCVPFVDRGRRLQYEEESGTVL